ncbi:hypothetical protein [Methanoregula boonei]|jgi:hypothetical protein|uniref:hypothetical protein n=1 Tax=Methanoregula boonei TaxID=358766 RepID=UPI0012FA1F10|nr:hypothetical protein [Methanoregula boonei]
MTSVIHNPAIIQASAGAAKKNRAKRKISPQGIFGLLPDWKIDTQEFRDEMRD